MNKVPTKSKTKQKKLFCTIDILLFKTMYFFVNALNPTFLHLLHRPKLLKRIFQINILLIVPGYEITDPPS